MLYPIAVLGLSSMTSIGAGLKTLILTEKPSVARDFAKALNITPKGEGFYESETTIVTWAIGHLMELKDPGEYDAKWKKWNLATLPILPDRLAYKPNRKTSKQLKIILKQMKRKDLQRIVVATDAGREGELIGRILINEAKPKSPQFRFWTSQALSSAVINEGMQNLQPLAEYDRLYYAARSRQSADWLVGMNMSRLATIRMGDLFSIGRVQTAVLALLVNRRKEIDSFQPEPYFTVLANFKFASGKYSGQWFDETKKEHGTQIKTKEELQKVLANCEGHKAVVSELSQERKSQNSPQLFSLTELQKVANRLYGFPAKKTLSIAQSLYERQKCLSYPRTDARVLGTKSFGQAKELIEKFRKTHSHYFEYFAPEKLNVKNRLVFNDARLTDHHALIPLRNPSLSGDDAKIFDLVLKRFIMAFSKNFEFEETKIITSVGLEKFRSRGQKNTCLGWKALSGGDKDKFLPRVSQGETGEVESLKSEAKMTRPPAEYTEATLLQDMINPSRLIEDKNYKAIFRGDVGLGTQATRAQIIETLLSRKYIFRKKKDIIALDKGITLVNNLRTLQLSKVLTNPEETARWELDLEKIAQGEGSPRDFMVAIRKFIVDCTGEWKVADVKALPRPKGAPFKRGARGAKNTGTTKKSPGTSIGTCPLCKKKVVDSPKSFSCEGWREGCKFTIWKTIAKKKISAKQAKKIIKDGKSDLIKGFKSKAGKNFDAVLEFKDGQVKFKFR